MSLRALIIDDSADFRLLVIQFLSQEWPGARIEEWDPLTRGEIDDNYDLGQHAVVFLDYKLGAADGVAWLRRLKRRSDCPPIIFLSGAGDESVAVRAMKHGAFDYLRKHDLSKQRLLETVHHALAETRRKGVSNGDSKRAAHALRGLDTPTTVAHDGNVSERRDDCDVPLPDIDGYRVLKRVGAGGVSTVYLAERVDDNVRMVLKVLDSKQRADDKFLMRFMQEFDLIARVESTHVVKIFGQGFTGSHMYLAMEYFANGDLRERIRKGLKPAEAIALLKQVALALKAIHDCGIIHRDLKPEHIMFRADDTLAIVDFGIAKSLTDTNNLTQTGHILGTPFYLSPEQARSEALDGRTDIYSAGIMTFEMLTQRRPFTAFTPTALANKHINEPIPRLPPGLTHYQPLIDRMMAKRAADRFENAEQLLVFIDQLPA